MRYLEKTLIAVALTFTLFCTNGWSFDKAAWFAEKNGAPAEKLGSANDSSAATTLSLPGYAVIYKEKERHTLRPEKEIFQKKTLSIEARIQSESKDPVSAVIFIKDKDGLWFQTKQEYKIIPGEWQRLETDIAGGSALIPAGHNGAWDGRHQVAMLAAGLSIYGKTARQFTIQCRNLELSGVRLVPPLQLMDEHW